MPADFLRDDCRELVRRGLLASDTLRQWEDQEGETSREVLVPQLRALFHADVDALVERLRVAQNAQHEQTLQPTDIAAVAAGGLLGALNAWMRPAPSAAAPVVSRAAPSLWASAFDAAQASLNVVRQRRLLDHLDIHHVCGDVSRADRVLLCVNGFMTQGGDPSRNWAAWAPQDVASTVLYAVQWEAGDARAWNEFCAHAHDNIKGTTSSSSTAHELLTHFTGNPWHMAQDKAEQVGILLAQVLAARPAFLRGRRVTLMGHSLGGSVVYSTLQELARMRRDGRVGSPDDPPLVQNALLFAAAFVPSTEGLQSMVQEIARDGRLVNVFSQRDDVLTKLFWAIQLQGGNPVAAGCASLPFPSGSQGVNIEVSDLVPPRLPNQFGHSYGPHMDQIRARVLPHVALN